MTLLLTTWVLALGLLPQHQHMAGGMDFDQAASVHHFRMARDGGAIEIETRSAADTALRDMVRTHLGTLPAEFGAGNFEKPFAVHAFLRYQIREHKTGDPVTVPK